MAAFFASCRRCRRQTRLYSQSLAQPSILMKNTSLLLLLGNAKRSRVLGATPLISIKQPARFRAVGGSRVLGATPLIASHLQLYEVPLGERIRRAVSEPVKKFLRSKIFRLNSSTRPARAFLSLSHKYSRFSRKGDYPR